MNAAAAAVDAVDVSAEGFLLTTAFPSLGLLKAITPTPPLCVTSKFFHVIVALLLCSACAPACGARAKLERPISVTAGVQFQLKFARRERD